MKDFAPRLLNWFRKNKRSLPWRDTKNPYHIWLSEIILQQTRVQQGLPYYQHFVEKFPTICDLAKAEKDTVFKLWQGLGYYRRAENLMKAAQKVCFEMDGCMPKDFYALKALPGIGEYTAAAIASIAYGEKVPVVDGNVYRVLSRVLGIKTEIGTAKAKKLFSERMLDLMQDAPPGNFNEAVMDFGAMQCIPANPDCTSCIFKEECFAYQNKEVSLLPKIKPKAKKRPLYLCYLVFAEKNNLWLRKRKENDIWRGLYDFPAIESAHKPDIPEWKKMMEDDWGIPKNAGDFLSGHYRQLLTHIALEACFVVIKSSPAFPNSDTSLIKIKKTDLARYPVPRLVERFLKDRGWL